MLSRGTIQLITNYTKNNKGAKTHSKYSCCRCLRGYNTKNELRLCDRCLKVFNNISFKCCRCNREYEDGLLKLCDRCLDLFNKI